MSASRARTLVVAALLAFGAQMLATGAAGGHLAAERALHAGTSRASARRHARARRTCRAHRRRCRRVRRHGRPTPVAQAPPPSAGGTSSQPAPSPLGSGGSGSPLVGAGSGQLASGGAAPAETPPAPSGPARVQVLAREYSFTLSRTEVPAGKVIVEFVNGGEDPHNLHLEEPTAGTEAGAFPTSAPKTHLDLTLELKPGTYTLFCSLPEHEAKGMKATLTVH